VFSATFHSDLEKVESNQSQLQMKNKGLKSEIEELEQQLEETEVNILEFSTFVVILNLLV